jgi:hypothetical protein
MVKKYKRCATVSSMAKEQKQTKGLKGFFLRAGKSFWDGGLFAKDTGLWMAKWAGKIGFVVATTSMVVFMPLLFEIGRETQVRESCIGILVAAKKSLYI